MNRPATGGRIYEEDAICIALMRWASVIQIRPGVKLSDRLIHIPNGGRRNKREAARLKRMGVKAGVSDYFLPVVRGRYLGLWLEIKKPRGRLIETQKDWGRAMKDEGYQFAVTYSLDEAIEVLTRYLAQKSSGKHVMPVEDIKGLLP